jgi:hypothetical protein
MLEDSFFSILLFSFEGLTSALAFGQRRSSQTLSLGL